MYWAEEMFMGMFGGMFGGMRGGFGGGGGGPFGPGGGFGFFSSDEPEYEDPEEAAERFKDESLPFRQARMEEQRKAREKRERDAARSAEAARQRKQDAAGASAEAEEAARARALERKKAMREAFLRASEQEQMRNEAIDAARAAERGPLLTTSRSMPTADAEGWNGSSATLGKVSMQRVVGTFRSVQTRRRWPSACSEVSAKKAGRARGEAARKAEETRHKKEQAAAQAERQERLADAKRRERERRAAGEWTVCFVSEHVDRVV